MPCDRVCQCRGEGWDGCTPEEQARERERIEGERKRERARQKAADLNLLSAPALPSLLALPALTEPAAPKLLIARPAPLALPKPEPRLVMDFEEDQVHVRRHA